MGSESLTHERYSVVRYKGGVSFGLFWKAPNPNTALIKKVMLQAQGVDRYLFSEESAFDRASNTASGVAEGNKHYVQADLKVYLAATAQGNYAFRASYVNGGLPPVFTDSRTFRYGFVFESADKK